MLNAQTATCVSRLIRPLLTASFPGCASHMLLGLWLYVTKLWLAYYIWRMETRGFPGSTLSSVAARSRARQKPQSSRAPSQRSAPLNTNALERFLGSPGGERSCHIQGSAFEKLQPSKLLMQSSSGLRSQWTSSSNSSLL